VPFSLGAGGGAVAGAERIVILGPGGRGESQTRCQNRGAYLLGPIAVANPSAPRPLRRTKFPLSHRGRSRTLGRPWPRVSQFEARLLTRGSGPPARRHLTGATRLQYPPANREHTRKAVISSTILYERKKTSFFGLTESA
jgi:hypothetical protein